jgi:hypothetical protein
MCGRELQGELGACAMGGAADQVWCGRAGPERVPGGVSWWLRRAGARRWMTLASGAGPAGGLWRMGQQSKEGARPGASAWGEASRGGRGFARRLGAVRARAGCEHGGSCVVLIEEGELGAVRRRGSAAWCGRARQCVAGRARRWSQGGSCTHEGARRGRGGGSSEAKRR